mmetsp:Transcript_56654/g.84270  ORF Transcript_56654/g.84270 Transcript_56654/m.84270 type:complete len:1109 (+) Transcript_56654:520-3846(+)
MQGPKFKKQRAAVLALVGSHQLKLKKMQKQQQRQSLSSSVTGASSAGKKQGRGTTTMGDDTKSSSTSLSSSLPPLPLSASCSTVCDIASQLLKQCLGLELYDGAVLVAESVSTYMKERVMRQQNRATRHRMNELRLKKRMGLLVEVVAEFYNEIRHNFNDSEDEDEEKTLLSDDNALDEEENENLLESMERGILPAELQFLHSLGLIGSGGRDYIAWCLFKSIGNLDDHPPTSEVDTGIKPDTSWLVFRQAMVDPMHKTAAFAFTADLLQKMGKEKEWSVKLADVYQDHFEELNRNGTLDMFDLSNNDKNSIALTMQHNQILKIILATARMQLWKAKKLSSKLLLLRNRKNSEVAKEKLEKLMHLPMFTIDTMARFEQVLWSNVAADGSLKQSTIEMLNILSSAFNLTIDCAIASDCLSKTDVISELLMKVRHVVYRLCKEMKADTNENSTADKSALDSWKKFPLPCDWQSAFHRALSIRLLNLCIGSIVSSFSGWEKEEFTLNLMKRREDSNYFGVKVRGMQVAGHANSEEEVELSQQWAIATKLLPVLKKFDFQGYLTKFKASDWYKESSSQFEEIQKKHKVSVYGENSGIKILLCFSRLCLATAENEKGIAKEESIKCALSIILPFSQFCLDQPLWLSNIGTKATTQDGGSELGTLFQSKQNEGGAGHDQFVHTAFPSSQRSKKKKFNKQHKSSHSKLQKKKTHISPSPLVRPSPLSRLVKVPASLLLKEWSKSATEEGGSDLPKSKELCSEEAKFAMKKLDYTIRQLRSCFTVSALQKSSLQVAAALLEVAEQKECHNPFLCLQQAAMFAGQGTKLGNNDEVFKQPLPNERECSPTEAIAILGRADCMHSIHFTDQAVFLCSFVAKVCLLHRDREIPELMWTSQWRVVGIKMYMVSTAIDSTIVSVLEGDAQEAALMSWEKDVKEEIKRGKSDAFALTRASRSLATTNDSFLLPSEGEADENVQYDGANISGQESQAEDNENSSGEDCADENDDEEDEGSECSEKSQAGSEHECHENNDAGNTNSKHKSDEEQVEDSPTMANVTYGAEQNVHLAEQNTHSVEQNTHAVEHSAHVETTYEPIYHDYGSSSSSDESDGECILTAEV